MPIDFSDFNQEAKAPTSGVIDFSDFNDLAKQEAPKKESKFSNPLKDVAGVGETALNMISSIPSFVTGTAGKLGVAAAGLATGTVPSGKDFDEGAQASTPSIFNKMTYEPRTDAGKAISEGMGQAFDAAGRAPGAAIQSALQGGGQSGAKALMNDPNAIGPNLSNLAVQAGMVGEMAHGIAKFKPKEAAEGKTDEQLIEEAEAAIKERDAAKQGQEAQANQDFQSAQQEQIPVGENAYGVDSSKFVPDENGMPVNQDSRVQQVDAQQPDLFGESATKEAASNLSTEPPPDRPTIGQANQIEDNGLLSAEQAPISEGAKPNADISDFPLVPKEDSYTSGAPLSLPIEQTRTLGGTGKKGFGQGGAIDFGKKIPSLEEFSKKFPNEHPEDIKTVYDQKYKQQLVSKQIDKIPGLKKPEANTSLTRNAKLIDKVSDEIFRNINNKEATARITYNHKLDMEAGASKGIREQIPDAIEGKRVSSLPKEGQEVARKYQTLMKDIGERAKAADVIEGTLENYVTHIVDWEKSNVSPTHAFLENLLGKEIKGGAGMSTKSKFGKERKYNTFEELQKAIKDKGLSVVTKDISEIYHTYARSMERAIENKQLLGNLKQIHDANGNPIISKITEGNGVPRGWQILDSSQFRGYAVHPDIYPDLKFAMEAKTPPEWFQAMHGLTQVVKRINVLGSFFHAKSLIESLWSSTSPLHVAKEGVLATGDKLFGSKNAGITKALDMYRNGGLGDSVDGWLKSGLVVSIPEDVTMGLLKASGKFADDLITKYASETHKTEAALSTVEKHTLGLTDKFTWDYLHTGLKLSVAEKYLADMKRTSGAAFDEAKARTEISRFINNSFGGLNWYDVARQSDGWMRERMMGLLNKESRQWFQVLMFAPDWTTSTIRAFTTGMPKTFNPMKWKPIEGIKGMQKPATQTDFARLYQLRTVLTYFTLINGINMLTAHRFIWNNSDPTRLEFKDGTSMQVAKHAMEPYHWMLDFDKTFANKLGFIPKAAGPILGGLEYLSPHAPKLVDQSMKSRAEATAKGILPFQVTSAMNAPKGEATQRVMASQFGFPVYGQTAGQKALKMKQDDLEKQKLSIEHQKDVAKRARASTFFK